MNGRMLILTFMEGSLVLLVLGEDIGGLLLGYDGSC